MTTISTLLAAGTGAASSSDVEVQDGFAARLTVSGAGSLLVEPKVPDGYAAAETIGGTGIRSVMIYGPITFRVTRPHDSSAGAVLEVA